jgi:type III restriction enzyme
MADQFFEQPILNSPYEYPAQHWALEDGQPTNQIISRRRRADFKTPSVLQPKKRRQGQGVQKELVLYGEDGLSTEVQQYDPNPIINSIREQAQGFSLPFIQSIPTNCPD